MAKYASEYVKLLQSWIGKKESDGSHKEIIDIYNDHRPLARGYKVKYNDAWCATTLSAGAIKLDYIDIMPLECGCGQQIELWKKMQCWVEDDAHIPNIGEWIYYDWDDSGKGDNTGWPEHVGVVEKVVNGVITVIEGNYNNSVKRRNIKVNAKNIRGYGVPKYDTEPVEEPAPAPEPEPKPVVKVINSKVLDFQKAAIKDGFKFPKYGADGQWGSECESVAKKAICKRYLLTYKNINLTKIIQKAVGIKVDGKFGKNTKAAVIKFQEKHGLVADGCVGIKTWKKILGV